MELEFSDLVDDLDDMTDDQTEAVIIITVAGDHVEVSARGDWQLINDALDAALTRHRAS